MVCFITSFRKRPVFAGLFSFAVREAVHLVRKTTHSPSRCLKRWVAAGVRFVLPLVAAANVCYNGFESDHNHQGGSRYVVFAAIRLGQTDRGLSLSTLSGAAQY